MIRAFAPLMKESGDGVVINVSSISGFTGSGNNIGYCAAKAALDTMTMSLARVLGPQVRVLCVSPAGVHSLACSSCPLVSGDCLGQLHAARCINLSAHALTSSGR
jgi:NAD(P)-dependent dehydrogenase (short-subunit alcohol dehydrogenase family)